MKKMKNKINQLNTSKSYKQDSDSQTRFTMDEKKNSILLSKNTKSKEDLKTLKMDMMKLKLDFYKERIDRKD